MLTGVQVDHELRQGAVQRAIGPRSTAKRAGQLGSGLEVQASAEFTQGNVVLDVEIEGLGAPTAHFNVVVFAGTDRYAGIRQVGDGQQDAVQFGLDLVQFGLAGRQLLAMRSTSAISGAMSSPLALAWPMDLERALRSACSCSVRVCTPCGVLPVIDARDIQAEATEARRSATS